MLRRLAGATAGAGFFVAAQNVVTLLTAVLLARWLGPAEYGLYTFTVSLLAILSILGAAGLPNLLSREVAAADAADDGSRGVPRTIIKRGSELALALSIFTMLSGIAAMAVFGVLDDPDRRTTVLIGMLSIPALVLLPLLASGIRSLHNVVLGTFINVLLPYALLLTFAVAAYFFAPAWISSAGATAMRFAGFLLALFVAAAVAWYITKRPKIPGSDRSPSHRTLAVSALPFLLINGSNIILARSDSVMLGIMIDDAAVGIYAIALQGGAVAGLALQAASMAVNPAFARLATQNDWRNLERLSIRTAQAVFAVSLPVAAVLIAFGDPLIVLIFGEAYQAAYPAFAIILAGTAASLIFGNPGALLTMTGHQDDYSRIFLSFAALNVVLNLIIIPRYELIGAACTTAGCMIGWRLVAYIVARKRLGIRSAVFDRLLVRSEAKE